jgi:hypothetical protein
MRRLRKGAGGEVAVAARSEEASAKRGDAAAPAIMLPSTWLSTPTPSTVDTAINPDATINTAGREEKWRRQGYE